MRDKLRFLLLARLVPKRHDCISRRLNQWQLEVLPAPRASNHQGGELFGLADLRLAMRAGDIEHYPTLHAEHGQFNN